MKKNVHPQYHKEAKISCACGRAFVFGSAIPKMEVEICSGCHPFYTGEKKLVDTAGRAERFKARRAKAAASDAAAALKAAKKPRAKKRK